MSVSIAQVTAEHHHDGFGIFHSMPRLSWRFSQTDTKDWRQTSYDLTIVRSGAEEKYHVDSPESVLVPWPSSPLRSREVVQISARANGADGSQTQWASLSVEVALLERSDWKAEMISGPKQPVEQPKKPFRLRRRFNYLGQGPARLYATAHGIYQVEINGKVVGDQVLAPGWQSYHHRLYYQTYDVSSLLQDGKNVIGAYVAEGWYAGRLSRPSVSNVWGSRLGFLAQLEVDGKIFCATDPSWEWLDGPIQAASIYDGEVFDSSLQLQDDGWCESQNPTAAAGSAEVVPFPKAQLIAPEMAPVRRIMEVKPKEIITTPSGKIILDLRQNIVGWLRWETAVPGNTDKQVMIRHAEVLEHGELGTRPLRDAKALSVVKLGGKTKGYEPKFTFFGFRYAEINGLDSVSLNDFTAIVISSDLRRTGHFSCSHEHINQLHSNTVWSMRGNFVSLPTDCPQRDERLGWTGDIQAFAPTANYLFDTTAFLGGWLKDLEADQRDHDGVPPVISPVVKKPPLNAETRPMAVWVDCVIITPRDLQMASGDAAILETQWESMCLWLEKGVPRDERGLYTTDSPQYGDWLDPRAPPALPGHCPTDSYLVANAYLVYVTALAGEIANDLGKSEEAAKYLFQENELLDHFQKEYITPNGRLSSHTQTAYALALHFGLLRSKAEKRNGAEVLGTLIKWEAFKIQTGFAGTPMILQVLANNGLLSLAYRMLQERDDPSWLYPVRMGATTIWERWNSMLPDGTINPGQMTSFNHYALGSVCDFLHRTVGGLSAEKPGWKRALVQPQPGGTVHQAETSFNSPYGLFAVSWKCEASHMTTQLRVPPNAEAHVMLNGVDVTVGSGVHSWKTEWHDDPEWPPEIIQGPQRIPVVAEFVP